MVKILPSLASADQLHLEQEIQKAKKAGYLHFDIEDGNFVPNITFGMKTVKSACAILDHVVCDAHLMVTNPMEYLEELSAAGFQGTAFHWESASYPMRLVNKIRKLGMRAGIALNPRTPAGELTDYLDRIDYLLLMSSEPDGEGELFQTEVLNKIRFFREKNKKIEIWADGGVNEQNFRQVISAGAGGVVLGRAFFQAEDTEDLLTRLQREDCERI